MSDKSIQGNTPDFLSGTVDNLTDSQKELLQNFKNHLIKLGLHNDTQYDDWNQLRFCRARKFVLDDVIKMFDDYMIFRKKYSIDTLLQENVTEYLDIRDTFCDEYVMGCDNFGYPIVYQSFKKFTEKKQLVMTEDMYVKYIIYKLEFILYVVCPFLSKLHNKRIDRLTMILDLKGTSISEFLDGKVRSYMGKGLNVGNFYYPETLCKTFIINAPFLFYAQWKIVKMFLDKVTVKKISILGSSYKKEQFACIDKSQVSRFLGGTSDEEYTRFAKRPWTDYENYTIKKQTFFTYPGSRLSDPLIASRILIYDPKEIEAQLNSQNTTKDQTDKLLDEKEDDDIFLMDDDSTDEGILFSPLKLTPVKKWCIVQEGHLLTI